MQLNISSLPYHFDELSKLIYDLATKFKIIDITESRLHCVKSDRIRNYYGLQFFTFELNTERYSVTVRIQSECGKIRTRITPNKNIFYAVLRSEKSPSTDINLPNYNIDCAN